MRKSELTSCLVVGVLALALGASPASAQTNPGGGGGQVPGTVDDIQPWEVAGEVVLQNEVILAEVGHEPIVLASLGAQPVGANLFSLPGVASHFFYLQVVPPGYWQVPLVVRGPVVLRNRMCSPVNASRSLLNNSNGTSTEWNYYPRGKCVPHPGSYCVEWRNTIIGRRTVYDLWNGQGYIQSETSLLGNASFQCKGTPLPAGDGCPNGSEIIYIDQFPDNVGYFPHTTLLGPNELNGSAQDGYQFMSLVGKWLAGQIGAGATDICKAHGAYEYVPESTDIQAVPVFQSDLNSSGGLPGGSAWRRDANGNYVPVNEFPREKRWDNLGYTQFGNNPRVGFSYKARIACRKCK
jgi:hypothetical protein